ncbi:hypothetical protein X753_20395 [Mesorhizobium sp. LNJC399B00]|nr:hypothetical protein X753_20395 [Mesorhizobium sp. LNJC399B00]
MSEGELVQLNHVLLERTCWKKFERYLECAPRTGQGQAAVLTILPGVLVLELLRAEIAER